MAALAAMVVGEAIRGLGRGRIFASVLAESSPVAVPRHSSTRHLRRYAKKEEAVVVVVAVAAAAIAMTGKGRLHALVLTKASPEEPASWPPRSRTRYLHFYIREEELVEVAAATTILVTAKIELVVAFEITARKMLGCEEDHPISLIPARHSRLHEFDWYGIHDPHIFSSLLVLLLLWMVAVEKEEAEVSKSERRMRVEGHDDG
jgi:hypothetical protein